MEDSSKNGMVKSTEFQLEDTSVFLQPLQRISTRFWTISLLHKMKLNKFFVCFDKTNQMAKKAIKTKQQNITLEFP
jgi:hypothetical protein